MFREASKGAWGFGNDRVINIRGKLTEANLQPVQLGIAENETTNFSMTAALRIDKSACGGTKLLCFAERQRGSIMAKVNQVMGVVQRMYRHAPTG